MQIFIVIFFSIYKRDITIHVWLKIFIMYKCFALIWCVNLECQEKNCQNRFIPFVCKCKTGYKFHISTLLVSAASRGGVMMSLGKCVVNFHPSVWVYLCTDWRMEAAASTSDAYLAINHTVWVFIFIKPFFLATPERHHATFTTKCPGDVRGGDWMLIMDLGKFPRTAWSHPEGSEL